MQFPATPGWVPLSVVVGVPRHSWLRAPGAVPASPGWAPLVVVVCGPSPLLAAGPGCGSPPLLAWVRRLRWAVSWGRGVSRVVCVCGVGSRAWRSCFFVFCVFVVSVLLVGWRGGVVWLCLPRALVCVLACAWCVGGLWLLVPASLGWGLRLLFVWVWLVCVVGGPSPLLAEGVGCSSPPLLAGVCRLWLWLVPRHSWLRVVVAVPRHS